MGKTFKHAICGTAILLLLPFIVWITGWYWQVPVADSLWMRFLFLVTETVSSPWGILTSVLLSIWFLWLINHRTPLKRQGMIGLIAIFCTVIMGGQLIKIAIKSYTQEARPYVYWVSSKAKITPEAFYELPRQERKALIKEMLKEGGDIPVWLEEHWIKNTDYSFPSGHMIFAAAWALLGVIVLWPRRYYASVALLMTWAQLVSGSRLSLGMHWPVDVTISTIFCCFFALMAGCLLNRFKRVFHLRA